MLLLPNYYRLYQDFVLEVSICAVLGQEVCLQRGEACEFKSWMELGSCVTHGKIFPSLLRSYAPIEVFVGCKLTYVNFNMILCFLILLLEYGNCILFHFIRSVFVVFKILLLA